MITIKIKNVSVKDLTKILELCNEVGINYRLNINTRKTLSDYINEIKELKNTIEMMDITSIKDK